MRGKKFWAVAAAGAAGLMLPLLPAQASPSGMACTAGTSQSQVSVGDFVWYDADGDGRQGGAVDQPLAGVVVQLTGPDGGPVTDINGVVVAPVTTDAGGYYEFVQLPMLGAGEHYTVTVDPSSVPGDLVPTLEGVGDAEGDSATWTASTGDLATDGACDASLDFGFTDPSGVDPVVDEPRQPVIKTMASTSTGTVGVRVRDKVWISGLEATDRVVVRWTLHGPAKPVNGKCGKVKWGKQPVLTTGKFTMTGNGTYVTRKIKLAKVGCYTFSDVIAKTAHTRAAKHKPGHPAQTVRVFPKRTMPIHTGGAGYL